MLDEKKMDLLYDLATCEDCFQYECSNNVDFCERKASEGSCPVSIWELPEHEDIPIDYK